MAEAVTLFLLDRNIAGCTSATIAAYRFQLKPFIAWCGEQAVDLDTLTEDDVRSGTLTATYMGGDGSKGTVSWQIMNY